MVPRVLNAHFPGARSVTVQPVGMDAQEFVGDLFRDGARVHSHTVGEHPPRLRVKGHRPSRDKKRSAYHSDLGALRSFHPNLTETSPFSVLLADRPSSRSSGAARAHYVRRSPMSAE